MMEKIGAHLGKPEKQINIVVGKRLHTEVECPEEEVEEAKISKI